MVRKLDDETLKNYKMAGIEPKYTAEDINSIRFEKETQKQQKSKRINTLYRIKAAGKEYIVYNATTIATTQLGNERTDSGEYGVDTKRTWSYKLDPQTEQKVPVAVSGERTEYTIPFSPEKLEEIMASADAQEQEPKFYVYTPGVGSPYGGYSLQELLTKSYDDLRYKGEHGFYPEKPLENPDNAPNAVTTKKLVEDKKGLLKEKEYAESPDRVKELSGSEKVFKELDDAAIERKKQQQNQADRVQKTVEDNQVEVDPTQAKDPKQFQPQQQQQPKQQQKQRKRYYSQASKVEPDNSDSS